MLLYLKNVLYWPEDDRLRSKHFAVMWPDGIYYIIVLIYCCVLTVYNTLYKVFSVAETVSEKCLTVELREDDHKNTVASFVWTKFCLCSLFGRTTAGLWQSLAGDKLQEVGSFCANDWSYPALSLRSSHHASVNWSPTLVYVRFSGSTLFFACIQEFSMIICSFVSSPVWKCVNS